MLATIENRILAMNPKEIEKVQRLTEACLLMPQVSIETSHLIHAGMYSRTIMIPAGITLTGALIKIATLLIVSGKVLVFAGDKTVEIDGYSVLAASGNRKQAFYALKDTWITMIFPSDSLCVSDAEAEFTNEADLLLSRRGNESNNVTITGE